MRSNRSYGNLARKSLSGFVTLTPLLTMGRLAGRANLLRGRALKRGSAFADSIAQNSVVEIIHAFFTHRGVYAQLPGLCVERAA